MKSDLVHRFLEQRAQEQPEATLIQHGNQQATYGEIEAGANRVAHALLLQGVKRGDRVGLIAPNSQFYVEAYYGILKAAAIVVSLNAAGDWRDHCDLLDRCESKGLVCGPRIGQRVRQIERLSSLQFLIGSASLWAGKLARNSKCRLLDGQQLLPTMDDRPPNVALSDRDRAAIIYTSGSTGQPKGATLTHANIVANTESIIQYLRLGANDRIFVVLPFHYVYGKSLLNTHVAAGGSVAIENHFLFPQKALDNLEQSEATGFSGVPSTFAILLNRSNFAERTLPCLRYVTQAGGAMAPQLQRRLMDALPGTAIFIMYGATEASARLSYLDPIDLPRKIGSIGKAIPNVTLQVLREDGTEADVDEIGELVANGANIMEGYWNDVAATAAVLDQNGYHTGDLGRRDEEGFLYVVGRSREMIKSGAHRIAPKEIEEVLQEHPHVHEAAVIGIPDEILGESIAAFVSARPDHRPDSREILNWCRKKLPSHKVPNDLQVLGEFQRNAAGKINKLALSDAVITST